jgi:hypothetical protein
VIHHIIEQIARLDSKLKWIIAVGLAAISKYALEDDEDEHKSIFVVDD